MWTSSPLILFRDKYTGGDLMSPVYSLYEALAEVPYHLDNHSFPNVLHVTLATKRPSQQDYWMATHTVLPFRNFTG